MLFCLHALVTCCLFFFFKQKTAYEMRISDWSSDVCSSDLLGEEAAKVPARNEQEQRERHSQHDQQRSRGKARGLDEDEAAPLQEWQQAAQVCRRGPVGEMRDHHCPPPATMRMASARLCPRRSQSWIAA